MELIAREESRRNAVMLDLMRAAEHGSSRGFKEFSKKLTEMGA